MSSLFLLSGLFLGWSLGANDAANIFGTGVKTRMFTFRKAATIASIFVILGAVFGGAATSYTIGKLGSINTIGGAFTVALCAGIVVTIMTKAGLPVSTTHAIIGGIVGWRLFTYSLLDIKSFQKIILSWFFSPFFTALISFFLFKFLRRLIKNLKIHLLTIDNILREGLILVAILGGYTLGANNIANVVGIFIPNFPVRELYIGNIFKIKGYQLLLFLGGLSISLGIITYSKKVIETVGGEIFKLSPLSALVVVLSESIVLYLFSSKTFSKILDFFHLPKLPLVPVSSSHCVVGGVLGIGFAKGIRGLNLKAILRIFLGWLISPISTMILTFFLLFFVQNVFNVEVYKPIYYRINFEYLKKLNSEGINIKNLSDIVDRNFNNALELYSELKKRGVDRKKIRRIVEGAEIVNIYIEPKKLEYYILNERLNNSEKNILLNLKDKIFIYKWEIIEPLTKVYQIEEKIEFFLNYFKK